MKQYQILGLFFATLLLASPAWALSLDEAKRSALVGETPSGYLEVVKPSAEVNQLAQEINAKRREAYKRIAQKNGTKLEAVEQIGGKEAIEKAPAGAVVKLPNGKWVKK